MLLTELIRLLHIVEVYELAVMVVEVKLHYFLCWYGMEESGLPYTMAILHLENAPPHYQLNRRLGGPQRWSGHFGEERSRVPASICALDCPSCTLITVLPHCVTSDVYMLYGTTQVKRIPCSKHVGLLLQDRLKFSCSLGGVLGLKDNLLHFRALPGGCLCHGRAGVCSGRL